MTFWTAVRIWQSSTAYILGGGPSLKSMDLSPLHDKRVIGVNNAYQLGDWVDVCWFGDSQWYDNHRERLEQFPGMRVHCCNRHADRPGTKRIMRGKPVGIDPRPSFIAWNGNSGASAINLAYHFGAKRVVLLGFDMKFGDLGENNWHNDHKLPSRKGRHPWDPYPGFLKNFPDIKRDADRLGFEIFNATPDSALDVFPKVKLEEVL